MLDLIEQAIVDTILHGSHRAKIRTLSEENRILRSRAMTLSRFVAEHKLEDTLEKWLQAREKSRT